MLDEEDYEDDSGDPELAFVRLERKFRQRLKDDLAKLDENSGPWDSYYIEYMNHTLAAAEAYGLDVLSFYRVPSHSDKDVWERFKDFTTEVDRYAVMIKIAHAQGRRAFSVVLSTAEKEKLRHYVSQIKTVIDESTLPQDKREALYSKINAFLGAVDADRTPIQKFSELVISTAHVGGGAAEALEPTWKWVRLIAAMFGVKLEEQTSKLPPPRPREKIDAPKKQERLPPPAGPKRYDLDDDIPF